MEPIARLFLCLRCCTQTTLCSGCDHGQIYCSRLCSHLARQQSLRATRARYQNTPKGRRHHAAAQARYRARLKKKVMDHGSPLVASNALLFSLENKPQKQINHLATATPCCRLCGKCISAWFRNDFLRRNNPKKSIRVKAYPQAP